MPTKYPTKFATTKAEETAQAVVGCFGLILTVLWTLFLVVALIGLTKWVF